MEEERRKGRGKQMARVASILFLLQLLEREASGANCEDIEKLKDELKLYTDAKNANDWNGMANAAAGIGDLIGRLTGGGPTMAGAVAADLTP